MKKKLSTSVVMMLMLILLCSSFTVFAGEINADVENSVQTETINNQLHVEKVNSIEFKELPEANVSDLQQESSMSEADSRVDINLNKNDTPTFELQRKARSSSSVTQSFSGTLPNEGDFANVNIRLEPGQIIQTNLQCPLNANLNYDLLLYEFNSDGTLGEMVESSTTSTYMNTYPDGSQKTVDEGLSYINTGTTGQDYAVIVLSTIGGSTTDTFGLTISLDISGSYDPAEPNDSPYTAYGIKEGVISGATLNVINDQDWYIWRTTDEFKSAKISTNQNYKVEVYTVNGNKMILTQKNTDGSYPLSTGVNYVKVFADVAAFTPSGYTLTTEPWDLKPFRMAVLMDGDQGQNSYPSYPQGSTYLRFKEFLTPQVALVSASGYPVRNCPVSLYWVSGAWSEGSGIQTAIADPVNTDDTGLAKLSLKIPVSAGSHSYLLNGPITFIHYYDFDEISVEVPGLTPYSTFVYHFAYSSYVSS